METDYSKEGKKALSIFNSWRKEKTQTTICLSEYPKIEPKQVCVANMLLFLGVLTMGHVVVLFLAGGPETIILCKNNRLAEKRMWTDMHDQTTHQKNLALTNQGGQYYRLNSNA